MKSKNTPTLHENEISAIEAIPRRFIPNIDTLSLEQRDEAIITQKGDITRAIYTWFFKHHFNYTYTPSSILEPDPNEPPLDFEHQHRLNLILLSILGIGENKFFLNEWLPDERNILSFPTLGDYDKLVHAQQEKWRVEDKNIPSYTEAADYYVRLYGNWARAYINQDGKPEFKYLILNCGSAYVIQAIDTYCSDLVEELIPYKFERGPNDGRVTKDGHIEMDMHRNANGKEKELERLIKFSHTLQSEIAPEIGEEFETLALNCIWIKDISDTPADPTWNYIFSDSSALDVRFTHWQSDTEAKQTHSFEVLDNITNKYLERAKDSLIKYAESLNIS